MSTNGVNTTFTTADIIAAYERARELMKNIPRLITKVRCHWSLLHRIRQLAQPSVDSPSRLADVPIVEDISLPWDCYQIEYSDGSSELVTPAGKCERPAKS